MPTLPYEQLQFNAAQADIIRELFVRTADENYITARWCAGEQLHTDFLWLAAHALEKYMKAMLLMNGEAVAGDGHDIVGLYARVSAIAGDLLPVSLHKPANLDIHHWRAMTPEAFVARLHDNGNADNRYLIRGYVTQSQDVHMLDAMVFALRRLVCRLDGLYIYSDRVDAPTITNRALLTKQRDHVARFHLPLDAAIAAKKPSPLQHAVLNLNMAFAPKDYPHTGMRDGTSARETALLRRILDPLGSDEKETAAHGIALAAWVLESVKLPGSKKNPGVRQQIEDAVAAAKLKHKLP